MIIKYGWSPKTDALAASLQYAPILNRLKAEGKTGILCAVCGREHDPLSEDFFTFYGNVTVGLNGGIIGNHFDEDGTLACVTFLCRRRDCLHVLLKHCKTNNPLTGVEDDIQNQD